VTVKSQRKVLHIFRKFLPGTATFIRNQVQYHCDYKPYILYAEDVPGEMERELRERIKVVKVVEGIIQQKIYNHLRLLTLNSRRKALNYIRSIKPDIIHVHYGVDMLPFAGILRKAGIPVVVSFYGYDCTLFPRRFKGFGKKWLQQGVFNNPATHAVFAMSPDMKKDLISIGCDESLIRLHYYGSECSKFYTEYEKKSTELINFCIISGLTYKKGHLFLLKAWQKMQEYTDKPHQLLIYGSGELKDDIERYIYNQDLRDVRLMGPLVYGSPEHLAALQSADVFVHPSVTSPSGDKEGIPGALVEAMAAGLPVVSTYHAGIPYVIEDQQTGLLVEEHDVDQLAKSMAALCNDPVLRATIGKKARLHAIDSLDLVTKEQELEALYDDILSDIHETIKK
jgi:colanic acid/amylovoran biosynthesis glycosyltransferase